MSFVFESAAKSACKSDSRSCQPIPAQWGPIRALAMWLGLAAKSPARPRTAISDGQKNWLRDKQAMLALGDEMLSRSRRDNQPLSVVVLDVKDLPQRTRVFGTDIAGQFVSHALSKLNGIATSTGFAARTGATVFTVLLPGFGHDRAATAIHEALGNPCRIEFDAGNGDAVVVPEFMVQTVSRETASIEEVYQSLRRNISQTRINNQRRQNHLGREPESRPQPKELLLAGASTSSQGARQAVFWVATTPMPLGSLPGDRESHTQPMELEGAGQAVYRQIADTIPMPIGPR
jgi:GGDEF domain-containing protein